VVAAGTAVLAAVTGVYLAVPASAASFSGTLKGTPCSTTARACVDLDTQKAWLASGGVVTGGPFVIASGGYDRETPPGTFHVINKVQDYKSKSYPLPSGQPAPMPWAVFFEPGGVAFHGGDPKRASAGCIHLDTATAQNFFRTLNVGDEVQVVQSKDGIKNAFYKVHHQKPPNKTQQKKWEVGHTNALRKSQGLPPLPPPPDKKKDGDKKDGDKKDGDKKDKKDGGKKSSGKKSDKKD
jgi:hypothetical protein